MRVVIVGGGVIGCAVAERLTRDRHDVLLLERDRIGGHASGAAAGLLAPHSEEDGDDFDLGHRSLALYPELVERIERSGVAVEYREQETIRPALTAADERRLRRAGAGSWLDAAQALAEEPALNPRVRGAAVFPEAQVTPPRLVEALARTAAAQGVWAALRPATPDGRPVIGPVPEHEGLVIATGHNRNGILLAPITGELVARQIASM